MDRLNRKLALGYIYSKEFDDRSLEDEELYLYADSQATYYLALPYAIHVSSIFCMLVALITDINKLILFIVFLVSCLITLFFYMRYFERKYSPNEFRNEVLNASKQEKKAAVRFSMLFFLSSSLVFFFIEMPVLLLV